MIIKHDGHIYEKFMRCAKVCGLFLFLIVLFGCWLVGQANSNHMAAFSVAQFSLGKCAYKRVSWKLMHLDSRSIACITIALVIWRSGHTIPASSVNRLTISLSHASLCKQRDITQANHVTFWPCAQKTMFEWGVLVFRAFKIIPKNCFVYYRVSLPYTYQRNKKRQFFFRVMYTLTSNSWSKFLTTGTNTK